MTLQEQLRMAQVSRYPVCFTNKQQSVAEHAFGVALIVVELCKYAEDSDTANCALAYALVHDQDEVMSGDIASPFKRELKAKCPEVVQHLDPRLAEVPEVAKMIVKLADYLEAIHFLREYGGSRHANVVLGDIYNNFKDALKKAEMVLPWKMVSAARVMGDTI